MRTILYSLLLAFLACNVQAAEPIRVLILSGLNNHPWKQTTPVLKKTLEETGRFKVAVTNQPEQLTVEALGEYDVLVSNWNSWPKKGIEAAWSPELRKAYLDFVRNGKGHVVVHAGSSSFYKWPEYQLLCASSWKLGSTGHGPKHEFAVRLTDKEHAITRGLREFKATDELWHRPGMQEGVTVLAESFAAKERKGTGNWEPTLMVNSFGKGRNVTILLGHDGATMANPGFQAFLTRGTEWAATGQVTVPAPEN